MTNPFTYRPEDPEDLDWEDNWASNSMAWASDRFLGDICGGWIGRATNVLWTDCPCCLAIRWLLVGATTGLAVGLAF